MSGASNIGDKFMGDKRRSKTENDKRNKNGKKM
jgi:hypothetical protein